MNSIHTIIFNVSYFFNVGFSFDNLKTKFTICLLFMKKFVYFFAEIIVVLWRILLTIWKGDQNAVIVVFPSISFSLNRQFKYLLILPIHKLFHLLKLIQGLGMFKF